MAKAKHEMRAAKPSRKPEAELRAAPSSYDVTHPVGSAERFLDQAAKEALAAAAAGGIPKVRQLVPGAVKAMVKAADKYPDPLISEAARLPAEELARRAAKAEAFRRTMQANDAILREVSQALSPGETLAKIQLAAGVDSAVHGAARQDDKGGRTVRAAQGAQEDAPPADAEAPSGQPSGPRIVINPTTFRNSKDALCVAFNEGFRLWMEATGFEPQSEPTDAQRKFFSDTAYADDELQLRRTILARIATFDTSVKDPTDDQLAETAQFLNEILESPDWCKNDWERNSVQKLAKAVEAAVGAEPVEPRMEPVEPRAEAPLEARAAIGGGETEEEKPVQAPEAAGNPESGSEDLMTQVTNEAVAGLQAGIQDQQQPPEAAAQQPQDVAAQQPPAAAPQQQQEEEAAARRNPMGLSSGVWTGGAEGKGRELTAREAEAMRERIESGATVSDRQLAMFGLSRADNGQIVNGNGELFGGFGDRAPALRRQAADAGLDRKRDDSKRRV